MRRWVAAKVRHSEELRELWDAGERVDGRGRRLPRPYGARRLNRAINALYAVLDYGHVFHDVPKMTDKLRQSGLLLQEPAPIKAHFTIQQVALIIEAAGMLDERAFPGHKHVGRQALVATLLLSGLRIDEACSLLVGGVRRSEHILNIPDAKTPTGVREVTSSTAFDRSSMPTSTRFAPGPSANHRRLRRAMGLPRAPTTCARTSGTERSSSPRSLLPGGG